MSDPMKKIPLSPDFPDTAIESYGSAGAVASARSVKAVLLKVSCLVVRKMLITVNKANAHLSRSLT